MTEKILSQWLPKQRGYLLCCPVCEEEFVGRRNQRFCCEACKNKYHYEQRATAREKEGRWVKPMRNNIRILEALMKHVEKDTSLPMSENVLKAMGFDFEAPVQRMNTKNGAFLGIGNFLIHLHKTPEGTIQVEIHRKN